MKLWLLAGTSLFLSGVGCFRVTPDSPAPTGQPDDTAVDDTAIDDTAVDVLVPIAVVSDGANSRVRYIRLDNKTVIYDVSLAELHPELCGADDITCVLFGIEPGVDPKTNADTLLMTYGIIQTFEDGAPEALGSWLEQLELTEDGPVVSWSINKLDFITNFSDRPDICISETPCGEPKASDGLRGCGIHGVHDAELLRTDGGPIRLRVTGTARPSRVLFLEYDTTSDTSCAVVEEVLSEKTNSNWARFSNTNDADFVILPSGAEGLVINHKASTPSFDDGGVGRGKSTLWQRSERGDWGLLGEHPPQDSETASFLNAPHQSDLVTTDENTFVIFAHSNGNGTNFETEVFTMEDDHQGTIGVTRVNPETGALDYLYDGVLSKDPILNFIRDVDDLGDGTFLVTDSGCNYSIPIDCTRPGSIRHLTLPLDSAPSTSDPDIDGRWTTDGKNRILVEIEELDTLFDSPLECDLDIPYEADFRWSDQLGAVLSARVYTADLACTP